MDVGRDQNKSNDEFNEKEHLSNHGSINGEVKRISIPDQSTINIKSGENYNFEQYNEEFNPLESEGSQDGFALLKENEEDGDEEREVPRYNHKTRKAEQNSKNTDDYQKVPRTVTVVEHEQGFKSSGLSKSKLKSL